MIIHYLRVKNFCGITEKELYPRTKGITIIEGPNETGKSCFARALYILLEEMDTSAKKSVHAIQPIDLDVGPEIEAEIETGPYRFRLFKRYIKDKSTILTMIAPSPGNLKGREAHNKVQEILSATMDMSLWKALNIIQGETIEEIPTNSSLSRALSNAAGTVTVGNLEMNLYESVKAENEKYYTSRGATGELKMKRDLVDTLTKEAADLSNLLRRADGDIEEYLRLESHQRELNLNRGELEQDSKHQKEKLEKAKALLSELELATAKLTAATSEHEKILSEVESRNKLEQSITIAQTVLKDLEDGPDLEADFKASEQAYSEEKNKHQAAQLDLDKARTYRDLCQKDLEYLKLTLWLTQLRERRERVEIAEKVAESATCVLARYTVTEEALEEIQDVQDKLERAKGAMEIGLPSQEIEALDNIVLHMDGNPLAMSKGTIDKRLVTEETTIELPGKLAIKIHTGRGQDKLIEKHQIAEENLRGLFDRYNVKNLKEACLAKQQRQDAQRQIDEFEKVKQNDLRDLSIDKLTQLIVQNEECERMYIENRAEDSPSSSNIETAEEHLKTAEDRLNHAERAFRDSGKTLEKAERRRDKAGRDRVETISKASRAEGELSALTGSLESARRVTSDEALEINRIGGEKSLKALTTEHTHKKTEAQTLDVPSLELLSSNAEEAIISLDQRIEKAKENMDGIRGRLELYEQDGLSEKLSAKERELCQARRELDSLSRQAEAAKLLFEAMEFEKNAAQKKYLNPLKERIERLSRILYNSTFQVTLDGDLNVVSRTLDGRTLGFEQLSTGAKEQIGMISKLACAMIVSNESGVPLILDDALGYTDPSRIKAMDAILKVAGQDCQIILMTCYPSRYIGIGEALVDTMEQPSISSEQI